MSRKKTIFKVITVLVTVVIFIMAGYIVCNHMGLIDDMDFGAGAYYYADIPNFEKYSGEDIYQSTLPTWLAIVLFLAWGALMWRLWLWIDKRGKKD
ncbi:MAG: hypothetical protein KBT05_03125 [Bacteroidales bacterium]|nr:hypothetical protein [Candidatus Cryptobacteroides caccocaballi]